MNAPADRQEHLRMALEQIALDSMGTLTLAADEGWVRQHLADDCPVCAEAARRVAAVFDDLLLVAPPVQPPADVRARVLRAIGAASAPTPPAGNAADIQVWNRWPATSPRFFTLAADDGAWQDTAIAGIQARVLRVDEQRDEVTMLVRMAAGTSYPGHRHGGDEQCYVLQGDLQVEEIEMRAGDYQFAPAGSIHGVQRTRGGCTLLLVSSRRDEILAG